jgi:MFS family permease
MNIVTFSLLSIYLTHLLTGVVMVPFLPFIAEDFSNGLIVANIFMVIPFLVVIPFLFIAGFLSQKFRKRKLIMLGLSIYMFSALGCALSFNSYLFIFFRSLSGIGIGLVFPYASALISEYYVGEERNKILGLSGVVLYIGGSLSVVILGFLASIHWRLGFLIFLLAILPIYMLYKHLGDSNSDSYQSKFKWQYAWTFKIVVWICIVSYFFTILTVFIYFTELPFVIKYYKVGTVFDVSIAQSLFMMSAIIPNLFFANLKKYLGNGLFALQLFFLGMGFVLIACSHQTMILIYFGSISIGLGLGCVGNNYISIMQDYTSKLNRVNALSIYTAGMYLAQFISPLLLSYIKSLFHITKSSIILYGVGGVYFFVSLLIMIFIFKKLVFGKKAI